MEVQPCWTVFSVIPGSLDLNFPLDSHPQYPKYIQKTIYLLWSIGLYKVRINLLGFWGDLSGGFGFLEILAGQPELHILLTELWLQKCPKSCQTIWGKMHKMMGRGKLMPFICMYIHTCVCMCVRRDIYVVYRV